MNNYNRNKSKKNSSSSVRRQAAQQKQLDQKRSGDKYPNLTPPIHFVETKFKETGTAKFTSLIDPGGSHKDKTNLVEKVIPVLDSLGLNGELFIKVRTFLQNHVLANNGDNVPSRLRHRMACLKTCMSANAQTEFQSAEQLAKRDYLEQFEEVDIAAALMDDNLFYSYISDPSDDEVTNSGLTKEAYVDAEYTMYENYLDFQLGLILFKDSRRSLQKQIEYLKNQIAKPYGWTVDETMQRIEYMHLALKYLPIPSKHGQGVKQITDFNPSMRTLDKQTLREIQFRCMPEAWRTKMEDLPIDWSDIEAMSHQEFLDHLRKIEIKDRKEKEAHKLLKKKYDSASAEEGEVEPPRNKKKKSYEKGTGKPTWQGEARACELCKMAGMPESKYKSHNTDKCKDKEQWKAKLSGNAADRDEAITSRKKDWKKFAKSESRKLERADAYIKEMRTQLKKKTYRKESRVQEKPKKRKRYDPQYPNGKPVYSSDSDSSAVSGNSFTYTSDNS
jgi:hypothetical protein